jgi:hypothetical protein
MLPMRLTNTIKTWKNNLSAAVPLVLVSSLREVWVWRKDDYKG